MKEPSQIPRQRHVLVVDDNVELAQTFRELLEAFEYRVTTTGDGSQALQFILENEVDAIVCDLSMPHLEGDAFYEAARQARPEMSRRFIFVTGHVNNPKFDPFLKREKVQVLYKPVFMDNLLSALNAVFGETSTK
jgi:CheY-like chemotaxis protein